MSYQYTDQERRAWLVDNPWDTDADFGKVAETVGFQMWVIPYRGQQLADENPVLQPIADGIRERSGKLREFIHSEQEKFIRRYLEGGDL